MRVLITGATGLIGSRIVKDCLERDIKVNFLTTRKDKLDSLLVYLNWICIDCYRYFHERWENDMVKKLKFI